MVYHNSKMQLKLSLNYPFLTNTNLCKVNLLQELTIRDIKPFELVKALADNIQFIIFGSSKFQYFLKNQFYF